MKQVLVLMMAGAALLSAADTPRVSRAEVANVEKTVNSQLTGMFPDEPWLLLGMTRGVYVEGVGVIFSAEVNLATGPSPSPFNPTISPQVIAAHRDKKMSRMPKLRETMYAVVKSLSGAFPNLPGDEQVVFAVTLLRYPWEPAGGAPTQIVMHAPRAKLSDALAKNTPLTGAVAAQEY